jgi:hypothetical protein
MWVWKKMVPKCKLPKNIPLHIQGLNCGTNICELEDLLRKRDWAWIDRQNLGFKKKNSFKFFQLFVRKCLSQIHISLCLVILPKGGNARHHWGSRRSKCQVATLYRSSTSLSNGKQNPTCTSHHKVVGMRLYKRRQQRPKWKDSRTSNVETQVQVSPYGVGVKEGIGLIWSQGFGLDESNV